MINRPNIDSFAVKIEQVVREHWAAMQASGVAALQQALAMTSSPCMTPRSPKTPSPKKPVLRRGTSRTSAQIAELSERFLQAVCATPGQTMRELATFLGIPSSELHHPMLRLKQADQIRSIGQRALTRYFPTVSGAAKASPER